MNTENRRIETKIVGKEQPIPLLIKHLKTGECFTFTSGVFEDNIFLKTDEGVASIDCGSHWGDDTSWRKDQAIKRAIPVNPFKFKIID